MSDDNSNASGEPKFCRDCANIGTVPSGDATKYKCFARQNHAGYDLVTGGQLYVYVTCYESRAEDDPVNCGTIARWFTLAPPKTAPVYTAPAQPAPTKQSGFDLTVDPNQLAASQDAAKERMRLLLANRKSPAKAATNLLESL